MGRKKSGGIFSFFKGLGMLIAYPFVVLNTFSGGKKKKTKKKQPVTYKKITFKVAEPKIKTGPTTNIKTSNPYAYTKKQYNAHYKKNDLSDVDTIETLSKENSKKDKAIFEENYTKNDLLEDMVLIDMMSKENKKQNKKYNPGENNTFMTEDDDDFDWETHCEFCGELLEDCECEHRQLSCQDISQDIDDLEFDEMNDVWDEADQMDEMEDEEEIEEDDDDLSFDNFSSFDDEDDDF